MSAIIESFTSMQKTLPSSLRIGPPIPPKIPIDQNAASKMQGERFTRQSEYNQPAYGPSLPEHQNIAYEGDAKNPVRGNYITAPQSNVSYEAQQESARDYELAHPSAPLRPSIGSKVKSFFRRSKSNSIQPQSPGLMGSIKGIFKKSTPLPEAPQNPRPFQADELGGWPGPQKSSYYSGSAPSPVAPQSPSPFDSDVLTGWQGPQRNSYYS